MSTNRNLTKNPMSGPKAAALTISIALIVSALIAAWITAKVPGHKLKDFEDCLAFGMFLCAAPAVVGARWLSQDKREW